MVVPRRWSVVLVVVLVAVAAASARTAGASPASSCKGNQCKATVTPTRTATATPTRTPTATASPVPTVAPSPTATAIPSPSPTPVPTAPPTATATPVPLNTQMYPWYLLDSTGSVSTVNATMMWDGDTNQSSPLPTGTLTATVYDPGCPTGGCVYTHTITSSDYQWAPSAGGWSIHYAFALGTEYSSADTFWVSYSGDGTFAGTSAQAANT